MDTCLFAARLYALELKKGRYGKQILEALEKNRVSKEVLENSKLERRLSYYAFDDVAGERVRNLLFRFVRICHGRFDPVNDAVEKAMGLKQEKKESTPKKERKEEKKESGEKKQMKEDKKEKKVFTSSSNTSQGRGNLHSLKAVQKALKKRNDEAKKALKLKEKENKNKEDKQKKSMKTVNQAASAL